jgi:hypothetical protein
MIILTIIHALLIFFITWSMYKKNAAFKQLYWPALGAKLIAGVCLGFVYTYYYSVADTLDYFRDASRLAALARTDLSSYMNLLLYNEHLESMPLVFHQPRALFLTKITSVFNILTFDNYWVTGCYFSLISFWACWHLVQIIHRYIPSAGLAAVVAFLFVPSVVFWTSGLLKESLAIGALFYLTAFFLEIWFDKKMSVARYVFAVIALWLLWNLKYYYVGVFVPVVLTSVIYKFTVAKRFRLSPLREGLLWLAILIAPILAASFLHPNFNFDRLLEVIVINNGGYNELSAPGDAVGFSDLRPEPLSLLKNAPWALFSGLFRPLLWEASSVIQLIPGVENAVILVLFIAALFGLKKYSTATHRVLIFSVIVYIALLCVLITIAAPNFGTLSRYRTGYFAFFVFIILCNNPVIHYLERSFPRLVSH